MASRPRAVATTRPRAYAKAEFDVLCPLCGATTDVDADTTTIPCAGCGRVVRVVEDAAPSLPPVPSTPLAPTSRESFDARADESRPKAALHAWWLVPLATAVSSALGLRGNMWIWQVSIVGDIVFVATTVFAFLLAQRIAAANLGAAMVVAFPLHWLAYGLSWSTTIGEAPSGELFMFVLEMGWMGLLWCVLAVPILWAVQRAWERRAAPVQQPL